MSNYTENKKRLNSIRSEYDCQGDIIFRSAIQYLVEYGSDDLSDDWNYNCAVEDINNRHDAAEQEGKTLWVARNFELAILECAKKLAEVNTYDLLIYIQNEVWLSGEGMDYQRAIRLLKKCMEQIEGDEMYNNAEVLDTFKSIGFTDDELEEFGFEYLLNNEEEE